MRNTVYYRFIETEDYLEFHCSSAKAELLGSDCDCLSKRIRKAADPGSLQDWKDARAAEIKNYGMKEVL